MAARQASRVSAAASKPFEDLTIGRVVYYHDRVARAERPAIVIDVTDRDSGVVDLAVFVKPGESGAGGRSQAIPRFVVGARFQDGRLEPGHWGWPPTV